MALNSNKLPSSSGNLKIEPMPAATYPARIVGIVDLGLQAQSPFQGKDKPPTYKFAFTYEFVDEFLKDADGKDMKDKPRWLTEVMPIHNLSAEKAKSTIRYKAIDPENKHKGDFSKLIDIPVMVTVVHNPNKKVTGAVWENIGGVAAMRAKDAEKCPKLVNKPFVFDLDTPDVEVFNAVPKFLKKLITSGLEFEGSKLETLLTKSGYKAEEKEAPEEEAASEESPY